MYNAGTSQRIAYLEDVPPVLALVVESLVEHLHDLNEVVPMRRVRHNRTTQATQTYWL